jgi:hypothetical protein
LGLEAAKLRATLGPGTDSPVPAEKLSKPPFGSRLQLPLFEIPSPQFNLASFQHLLDGGTGAVSPADSA